MIRGIEPALAALANEVGLEEVQGLSAGLLAARIEDRFRLISESWDGARDLDTRMQDAQARIEELTIAQTEAVNRRDSWLERWALALPAIGLSAIATPDEAEAALAAWKDVPDNIRERDSRTRRVAGMQRDIAKFEERAKTLVDAFASDLLGPRAPNQLQYSAGPNRNTSENGTAEEGEKASDESVCEYEAVCLLFIYMRFIDEAGQLLKRRFGDRKAFKDRLDTHPKARDRLDRLDIMRLGGVSHPTALLAYAMSFFDKVLAYVGELPEDELIGSQ